MWGRNYQKYYLIGKRIERAYWYLNSEKKIVVLEISKDIFDSSPHLGQQSRFYSQILTNALAYSDLQK